MCGFLSYALHSFIWHVCALFQSSQYVLGICSVWFGLAVVLITIFDVLLLPQNVCFVNKQSEATKQFALPPFPISRLRNGIQWYEKRRKKNLRSFGCHDTQRRTTPTNSTSFQSPINVQNIYTLWIHVTKVMEHLTNDEMCVFLIESVPVTVAAATSAIVVFTKFFVVVVVFCSSITSTTNKNNVQNHFFRLTHVNHFKFTSNSANSAEFQCHCEKKLDRCLLSMIQ